MSKVPSLIKVHAYGKDVNDSYWITVAEHYQMYNISIVYPGTGTSYPRVCVPGYEVKQEIMALVGSLYEEQDIEQINLTWLYDVHGLLDTGEEE